MRNKGFTKRGTVLPKQYCKNDAVKFILSSMKLRVRNVFVIYAHYLLYMYSYVVINGIIKRHIANSLRYAPFCAMFDSLS